jgi:hypothetical protein
VGGVKPLKGNAGTKMSQDTLISITSTFKLLVHTDYQQQPAHCSKPSPARKPSGALFQDTTDCHKSLFAMGASLLGAGRVYDTPALPACWRMWS